MQLFAFMFCNRFDGVTSLISTSKSQQIPSGSDHLKQPVLPNGASSTRASEFPRFHPNLNLWSPLDEVHINPFQCPTMHPPSKNPFHPKNYSITIPSIPPARPKLQQGIRHALRLGDGCRLGLRLHGGHGGHGLQGRRAEGEQPQGARPGGHGKVTWLGGLDVILTMSP